MNRVARSALAGFAGAVTTNVLHEITRRVAPNAPRVDLLGMQSFAKSSEAIAGDTPRGRSLYGWTLAADLASNAAYFALAGAADRNALPAGAALGVAAGVGAVVVPPKLGLDASPTARTLPTQIMTTALYTVGGLAAAATYRALG